MHAKSQHGPSHKELNKKLKALAEQLNAGELPIAEPRKFRRDMEWLSVSTTEELVLKLKVLVSEVSPVDYVPPHVRKHSYEPACFGAPMFDFCWESESEAQKMYLKFAVNHGRCMLISCHPDEVEAGRVER